MKHLRQRVLGRYDVLFIGWLIFGFIIQPGDGISRPFTDSMVYDDIMRDVPRSLRLAHDRGYHFRKSERDVFPEIPSMKGLVEEVIQDIQNGADFGQLPEDFGNVSITPCQGMTSQCKRHLDEFFNALLHGKLWALKMLDAWGKPQSGMLAIHIRSFGDWYQCKRVVGQPTDPESDNATVRGLFCMATLTVYEDVTDVVDVSIQEGMCVPDGCTEADIRLLLDELLTLTNTSRYLTSHRVACHPPRTMDGLAVFGLTTFGLLVVGVTIATAIDFMCAEEDAEKTTHEEEGIKATEGNGIASINHHDNHHVTNNHVVSSRYQLMSPKIPLWNIHTNSFKAQLLLSFSLKKNFQKLFDTAPNKTDAMECIHGLRFFTMCWIIMGHTILLTAKRAENYVSYAQVVAPYFFYQIYYNSTFACDSFLVFSGILVCYNLLHHLRYFKGRMRWHLFYIYRYMRLTPAMGFVMLLYASTFQFWNDGPVWEAGGVEPHRCRFTWWHNLLYINNFFHNQCMGWLWYLAVDTQLYVISPIFVLLLYRKPRYGIALLLVSMVASLIGTAFLVHDLQLPPTSVSVLADNMTAKADPMVSYYYAPYIRLSPYVIGMLTGYLFYVTDRKIHIPKIWQIVGWGIVTPSSALIVFGLYRATLLNPDIVPLTLTEAVLYSTLSRPAWGLIVCWVIVICVTGHGGILNSILSWRPMVPLARTTYMAYMIHVIIQLWWLLSREKPVTLTDSGVFLMFAGYVLMTFAIAVPATLLFEAPIMSLQRAIIARYEKQKKERQQMRSAAASTTSVHDQGES